MSISFHIDFNGQSQEALEFYAAQLNGNIATMLQFKDSPVAKSVPPDWQHKIVHANISFEKEVETAFNALSANGEVILFPQKTFWSPSYAITVDRFDVPWKINCGL